MRVRFPLRELPLIKPPPLAGVSDYKYVSALPAGVYKSIQILLNEVLAGPYREEVYKQYLRQKSTCSDPAKILPKIKLKYYRKKKEPAFGDLKCAQCGKIGIDVGSTFKPYPNSKIKHFCEDCTIKNYKEQYGFETFEAAEARRRRMFDVGYLFNEIMTDEYLQRTGKEYKDLELEEMREIAESSKEFYNLLFSKNEKERIERIEDQKEIEKELRKKLNRIDLDSLFGNKNLDWPAWMDCAWRRIPCREDDCPICGKIKQDEEKYRKNGEDSDNFERVAEDIQENFTEALQTIKKDAEEKGLEIENLGEVKIPPRPEEFSLYNNVNEWRKSIMSLMQSARNLNNSWVKTEDGKDLEWYASLLATKTYRQLCNRWHIDNGDDYGEEDFEYTQYVLKETLKILSETLNELGQQNNKNKKDFKLASFFLSNIKEDILQI